MSEEDKGSQPAPGERMELPTWNRARTKRKVGEGPQDDAFQAGVKEIGRGAARRGLWVGVGAVAALLVVVIGVVVVSQRQASQAEATRALAAAARIESEGVVGDPTVLIGSTKAKPVMPILKDEAEREAALTKALEDLDARAPGSDAALAGALVKAADALREGKPSDAEALYREFLDRADAQHPLRFAAQEGFGFAREAQGDLDGALAAFQALAGEKGVFYRDMALWHQGRILERQGKPDAALEIYRQYLVEYPMQGPSIAQAEVRRRLEELDPKALAGAPAPESPVQAIEMPPGGVP